MVRNDFAERQLRAMGWKPTEDDSKPVAVKARPQANPSLGLGHKATSSTGNDLVRKKSGGWQGMLDDVFSSLHSNESDDKKKKTKSKRGDVEKEDDDDDEDKKKEPVVVERPKIEGKRPARTMFKLKRLADADNGGETSESLRTAYESERKKSKHRLST
eukprot:PhM_4_TR5294/c0_g1_i1/m.87021